MGIRASFVLPLFLLLAPSLTLKELMSLPPFITKRKYISMRKFLKERIGGLIMSQPTMIMRI